MEDIWELTSQGNGKFFSLTLAHEEAEELPSFTCHRAGRFLGVSHISEPKTAGLSLSLCFNGHFPGKPTLAGVY